MNLEDELREILDNSVIEEMFELTADFSIASTYAKIMHASVYIWTEFELPIFVRLFRNLGLSVHRIVSVLPKEFSSVDNVPIIAPADAASDPTPNKFFFLDSTDYDKSVITKLKRLFRGANLIGTYVLTEYDWVKIIGHSKTNFDLNRIEYYQSHKDELMEFFSMLSDDLSKRTLIEYLRSYLTNSPYRGEQTSNRYKYFFGAKNEVLYKRLPDECWINCGAASGDTIFLFFGWGLKAKKIYAFEGDPKMFQDMLRNLSLLTPDLRSIVEPINAFIDQSTDFDSILGRDERCTLLNADIEGDELNLLNSMSEIIKRDRPVISICVYHKREDLVDIPAYLRSICEDYVYSLRKYNTGWLLNYKRNHELALYAVPRERSLLQNG